METKIQSDMDYESITDRILYLGMEAELDAKTVFSKSKKDIKTREYYLSEFAYESRFVDKQTSYSIKRNMNTMFLIKYRPDSSLDVYITPENIYALKYQVLEPLKNFLLDPSNFKLVRGKPVMVNKTAYDFISNVFNMERSIRLQPGLEMINDVYDKVVYIFLSESVVIQINMENFMAFYDVIMHADFYNIFLHHCDFIAAWKKENYGKCLIQFSPGFNRKSYDYVESSNASNIRTDTELSQGTKQKYATGHTIQKMKQKNSMDDL